MLYYSIFREGVKVKKVTFKDVFGDMTGQTYNGNLDCSNNKLTSLEGAPEVVKGNFDCSYNKLTSLEGAPEVVEGDFDCSHNNLTSLEGVPYAVKIISDFDDETLKKYLLEKYPEQFL